MTSEKQIAANRANAQKSTGPTSEVGKNISRMNAMKHGLTGTVTIMTPEERTSHNAFVSGFVADLKPAGEVERNYATAAAESAWRLKRATSVDQNIFSLAHPEANGNPPEHDHFEIATAVSQARAFMENAKEFQLLTMYEQRIRRSMEKDLKALKELQTERKLSREKALEEAAGLARLNHLNRLPYNPDKDFPSENGFNFSSDEINDYINLTDRKREVAFFLKTDWRDEFPSAKHRPEVVKLPTAA